MRMTGDAMNEAEFETGKLGVAAMKFYQMQLACCLFCDLELARKVMDELLPQSTNLQLLAFKQRGDSSSL